MSNKNNLSLDVEYDIIDMLETLKPKITILENLQKS